MIDDLLSYLDYDKALREMAPETVEATLKRDEMDTIGTRLTKAEALLAREVLALRSTNRRLRHALNQLRQQNEDREREAIATKTELLGLRTYLKRSIAADIDGLDEVADLLDGLPTEDMVMVGRWIEAMREPAYWSKDIARLRQQNDEQATLLQQLSGEVKP